MQCGGFRTAARCIHSTHLLEVYGMHISTARDKHPEGGQRLIPALEAANQTCRRSYEYSHCSERDEYPSQSQEIMPLGGTMIGSEAKRVREGSDVSNTGRMTHVRYGTRSTDVPLMIFALVEA